MLRINDHEDSVKNGVSLSNLLYNFMAKLREQIRSSGIRKVGAERTEAYNMLSNGHDMVIACTNSQKPWRPV